MSFKTPLQTYNQSLVLNKWSELVTHFLPNIPILSL